MVRVEGGTQALRRTVDAPVEIVAGPTTMSSYPVPSPGVILKAAAYSSDSRDRDRHIFDAAALLVHQQRLVYKP